MMGIMKSNEHHALKWLALLHLHISIIGHDTSKCCMLLKEKGGTPFRMSPLAYIDLDELPGCRKTSGSGISTCNGPSY
jgi:hypothetical protein